MGAGKIKIFVFGRDKIGWSIDEDRKNIIYFLKLNKFEIVNSILKATHIFCVWYDLLYNLKYKWIAWLGKFLNKKTPKKDKLRILNKMLKEAEANGGTISVKRAREVIKNATSN